MALPIGSIVTTAGNSIGSIPINVRELQTKLSERTTFAASVGFLPRKRSTLIRRLPISADESKQNVPVQVQCHWGHESPHSATERRWIFQCFRNRGLQQRNFFGPQIDGYLSGTLYRQPTSNSNT